MILKKNILNIAVILFITFAANYTLAQTPACASDDRQPSSIAAVGRVVIPDVNNPEYATAFILSNGKLVTAGHICETVANHTDENLNHDSYVEFNVPASINGHAQPADPSNKYMIIHSSIFYHYNNYTDDWGVFEVYPNDVTGKMPLQRQGFLFVKRESPENNMPIRIIGFGDDHDDQTLRFTQQVNYGLVVGYDGLHQVLHVDNYAIGGMSGGPILDVNTGNVIGIIVGKTCAYVGYNMGSSFLKDLFWYKMRFVDITLAQQLENGDSTGTIDAWLTSAFYPYPTGTVLTFDYGTTHAFRADQTIVTNQKYNNWSGQASMENHISLSLTHNLSLTAQLKTTSTPVTITDKLISQNLSGYGNVSFKDPWLIDYADPNYGNNKRNQGMAAPFKSRQSPFSPDDTTNYNGDVYQGVFLGQGYQNGTWNPPYYSVKALSTQNSTAHGETVSYRFDRWGGTGVQYQYPDNLETPVVFNSAGATAEARYKGHLASNTVTATGPNGSRVLVRSRIKYDGYLYGSGKKYIYFMAYADGGEIWYNKAETDDQTTNSNFNWLSETKVSDGQGGNYNPSVTTLGNVVYFTWAQKVGNTWYIRFRYYNNNNNSYYWSPTATIASFTSTSTPTPQIALTENPVRVMVASNINGYVKAWLRKNGSWQYAGLNVTGSQPAICADNVDAGLLQPDYFGDIALVYSYNGDVYLRNWGTSSESWSGAKKVSVQNMFSLGNNRASVSY